MPVTINLLRRLRSPPGPVGQRKTVVLHIGRHKTGTSSIQATLKANDRLLRKRGLLYPKCLEKNHSEFFVNAFAARPETYVNNRLDDRTNGEFKRAALLQLKQVAKEASDFYGEKIVFSGEDACTALKQAEVQAMKEAFDGALNPERYQIILYTRHPVDRARSGMQQNIKSNRMTLEDAKRFYLAGGGKKYKQIFDLYAGVFGNSAVEFRSFEAALDCEGGLIGDFLRFLEIPADGIRRRRENDGISDEVIMFLSFLYDRSESAGKMKKAMYNRRMRISLTGHDRKALYSLESPAKSLLSFKEKTDIWNKAQGDVEFLAELFGIHYEKPAIEDEPASKLFGKAFLARLASVLPRLSKPARIELDRFVDSHTRR